MMTTEVTGAVASNAELGQDNEQAKFRAWLRAYAGGAENWRGNVLMGEADIALALWKDKQREILKERERFRALIFDGFRVLRELDEKAKKRTSHENVSDVLDALARLM